MKNYTIATIAFLVLGVAAGSLYSYQTVHQYHLQDPQVAMGSWIIDIQVPPCTGKVVNSGSSPDGGPLELSCVAMPVQTADDDCGYKADGKYHCGTNCGYKSDGQFHCGTNCGYEADGKFHCDGDGVRP